MCDVVKMAEITVSAQKSSLADCTERVTLCCRALLDPKVSAMLKPTLLSKGKTAFNAFLKTSKDKEISESKKNEVTAPSVQADDLIHVRQIRSSAVSGGELDLDDGSDLARATGYTDGAEAFVTVRDYDISLEILVINRTPTLLSNLNVELSTMGDMKIVERPQSQNIGPHDQSTIRASIKVSSTETGHIFGTIVYDDSDTQEKVYINLNDIHMDIMDDHIRPENCTDEVFRSKWAEFEWENKGAISTSITELHCFLNHVVNSMRCLTPHDTSEKKGSFLAANLYARR
jgi:coatomer subunit beta